MDSVFYKSIGEFIVHNISFSALVIIAIICGFLKMFFKIGKREIHPFRWIASKIGKAFTKELEEKVIELKDDSNQKMQEIKDDIANINTDHYEKIDALKDDLKSLKNDLDEFERKTNENIDQMKSGTTENCRILKEELGTVKKSNDIQTIRQIRTHILDFANSCKNGRRHSQEEFRSIFDENTEYETIVSKYDDIKNDYYTESLKFIKRVYQNCLDNNDFLA